MKFFDSLIRETETLLASSSKKGFLRTFPWKDAEQNQMILLRDTAFEVEGVGFNLVTSAEIPDGILLVGDDLDSIRENRQFARISLVQIQDGSNDQAEYNLIKKIDYVKYHIFPEGFMMRSTSRSYLEAVRISKTAIQNGINFQRIGSLMIDKYHQIPAVKGVTVIFVTAPNVDYVQFNKIAEKSHAVTETLNHVMNTVVFDCDTCNLKVICDEVEGMKSLHFSQSSGQ